MISNLELEDFTPKIATTMKNNAVILKLSTILLSQESTNVE